MQVDLAKDVKPAYADIQERKGKGRWMIVKYTKDGSAKLHKKVDKEEKEEASAETDALKAFTDAVKEADPCWGFIEYKDTVFFISYITENASAMLKMPMAFNRGKFKGNFDGIKVDMECTDAGMLEPKNFEAKIKKVG